MWTLNKFLGCLFFLFYWAIPVSIGQEGMNKIGYVEQKDTLVTHQKVIKVIRENAPKLIFGNINTQLTLDTEGGRNVAFDHLLAYFEQSSHYILVIRVKNGKELSKQRVAFLYSYIFKNTNLKAQQVEIKPYSPKDAAYLWTFENDELAISFDVM